MTVNKKFKVYVVGGGSCNWLEHHLNVELSNRFDNCDLAIFTGGGDIDPQLYGETKGTHTYPSYKRDESEVEFFTYFAKNKIPMFGICRGAQLICALSGGKLVQDANHPSRHTMQTLDGKTIMVNSLHHQQLFLLDKDDKGKNKLKEYLDYTLIGWANNLSGYHRNEFDVDMNLGAGYKEPEIVMFHKTNALGVQYHPEMMNYTEEAQIYTCELINNYLFNGKAEKIITQEIIEAAV